VIRGKRRGELLDRVLPDPAPLAELLLRNTPDAFRAGEALHDDEGGPDSFAPRRRRDADELIDRALDEILRGRNEVGEGFFGLFAEVEKGREI
jgi:hypothetical protein